MWAFVLIFSLYVVYLSDNTHISSSPYKNKCFFNYTAYTDFKSTAVFSHVDKTDTQMMHMYMLVAFNERLRNKAKPKNRWLPRRNTNNEWKLWDGPLIFGWESTLQI